MSYLFCFSGYQTKCVMNFILQSNDRQAKKEGRTEIQKIEYLKTKKSFLVEIKNIFHSFWKTIIWWKNKNLIKIADTSFKQGRLTLLINICSLLATSCLPRNFFVFFIILEKHDSYIALNCFSMDFS